MQLTKAFILLVLATHVRGDCAVCAQEVDHQPLVSNCYIGDDTFCAYSVVPSSVPTGPVCVYSSEGGLMAEFSSDATCPLTVDSTTDCTSCVPD
ncbi:hypothetical protein EDC04DRAFT_2759185 [Pisolithus marmoratus]|nr:hypothetical protein EDC04DRAFT_2759185 [Pisolithus marmoratus]